MQKPLIPAFLFALSLLVMGCSKTSDSPDTPDSLDFWVVTEYITEGLDHVQSNNPALYTGYTFEFNLNDDLVINTPDGSIVQGKWAVDTNANLFVIGLIDAPVPPLNEIYGDWTIVEYTGTTIQLSNPSSTDVTTNPDQGLSITFTKQ